MHVHMQLDVYVQYNSVAVLKYSILYTIMHLMWSEWVIIKKYSSLIESKLNSSWSNTHYQKKTNLDQKSTLTDGRSHSIRNRIHSCNEVEQWTASCSNRTEPMSAGSRDISALATCLRLRCHACFFSYTVAAWQSVCPTARCHSEK